LPLLKREWSIPSIAKLEPSSPPPLPAAFPLALSAAASLLLSVLKLERIDTVEVPEEVEVTLAAEEEETKEASLLYEAALYSERVSASTPFTSPYKSSLFPVLAEFFPWRARFRSLSVSAIFAMRAAGSAQ